MRNTMVIAVTVLLCAAAWAQPKSSAEWTNQLQLQLADKYDNIWDYSDGMIAVQKDGLWGYCDSTGREVIKPQFADQSTFTNGYADAKNIAGMVGVINKKGELVVPHLYDYVGSYTAGLFSARIMKGEQERYGFIDVTGKVIIPFEYEDVEISWFSSGTACVKKNGLYGAIDRTNKVVIPFEYDLILGFQNGIAVAYKKDKQMLINLKNETIIPTGKYDEITICDPNFIMVNKKERYGAVDQTGAVIVPLKYLGIGCLRYGCFQVDDKIDGLLCSYLVDLKGNTIFKGKNFFNITQLDENTFYCSSLNDELLYLYGRDGNTISPDGYDMLTPMAPDYILACRDGNCQYINHKGEKVGDYKP